VAQTSSSPVRAGPSANITQASASASITNSLDAPPAKAPKKNHSQANVRRQVAPVAKMDVSQQSPTQNNDDGDYERYFHHVSPNATSPLPSIHLPNTTGTLVEGKSLHEDDTGAVNFGALLGGNDSQLPEEPSSVADDFGFQPRRGAWRSIHTSSQHESRLNGASPHRPSAIAPRTPAPRRNPFATNGAKAVPEFVASQLFGQTQFSSAVKRLSPTSSRPSPNIVLNNSITPILGESSPLKNRANLSSPTQFDRSSPRTAGSLCLQDKPDETPTITRPTLEVQESPKYNFPKQRLAPEPIAEYEPMHKSQERKASGDVALDEDQTGSDLDEDESTDRHRRARMKKEAAERQLASISIRRPDREMSGGPPNRKRRRKMTPPLNARRLLHSFQPKEPEPSGSTEEDKVTDSQGHRTSVQPTPSLRSPRRSGHSSTGLIPSQHSVIVNSDQGINHGDPIEVPSKFTLNTEDEDIIPDTSPVVSRPLDIPDPEVLPGDVDEGTDPGLDVSSQSYRAKKSRRRPKKRYSKATRFGKTKCQVQPTPASSAACLSEWDGHAERSESYKQLDAEHGIATNLFAGTTAGAKITNVNETRTSPETAMPTNDVVQAPVRRESMEPATPTVQSSFPHAHVTTSVSSLSVLSRTPARSDKTSPATQESLPSTAATDKQSSSPSRAQKRRRITASLPRIETAPNAMKRATRSTRRSGPSMAEAASTDELAKSPSAVDFEASIAQPRTVLGRAHRGTNQHTIDAQPKTPKLFSGMAFAISFQGQRPGETQQQYAKRLEQVPAIEREIKKEGGRILQAGFDELFDLTGFRSNVTSPVDDTEGSSPLELGADARSLGFTALIADGHSRKVKYMQALALGLPCISHRWVTTCLNGAVVVPWEPYLLCAGKSLYLDDAILSRMLTPYSIADAKFADVIERRTKLLDGSTVLLVMKKSRKDEESQMAYIFLANVLGANLTRTYSVEEATSTMEARDTIDQPFDWIYVDEKTDADNVLDGAIARSNAFHVSSTALKKRKRSGDAPRACKKNRKLTNELVIQSLIMDRMIDDAIVEG
jgi:hypothetical protein